jgi:tRNA (guanine37-N1)-methyltransferase
MVVHFEVLSLFPGYIEGPIQESILKRAIQKGLIKVSNVDIRSFSSRKDKRVDDRPYGGGPGMVMMAEPAVAAIRSCKKDSSQVIYLSPRGTQLSPSLAKQLSKKEHLILLCGHYEGIDERAIELAVDLEVSIGDYVLTNGCLAALVLIDAVSRYIPGVLGHEEAASSDSFEKGLLEAPQYTVPRIFEGKKVPEVLFSGDHEKIALWREAEALRITQQRRPELVAKLFSENKPSYLEVALQKFVEPTSSFEKTCAFYRKLTGVAPEIQDGRATFFFEGASLSFMASNVEAQQQSLLYLNLPPAQFKKAFRWWSEKMAGEKEPLSTDTFLCTDPDGRKVIVGNL